MRIFTTGGSGFIGTNLLEELLLRGHEVRDFSLTSPVNSAHNSNWVEGDLLDSSKLRNVCMEFAPDIVIHLAARAECDETTTVEAGYSMNTIGTQNLLDAIKCTPSVQRVIITSSQYVCGPDRMPDNDQDYFPHTIYGQSKVVSEKMTRNAKLECCWTIVRPTNIWGPWHWRYPVEFWRIAASGLYVHPAGHPVIRCYGYVGNVIAQMMRILELPEKYACGKTFYLGDEAEDIYEWANGFCMALRAKPARKVPRLILQIGGFFGDIIGMLTGKPFYITSSRYKSMVTNYIAPMDATFSLLGKGPFSLQDGIERTVSWLQQQKVNKK